MAQYEITETNAAGAITAYRLRRTRPAAYGAAYRLWYAELGVSAGRDTQWGWNGVKALDAWLIDRTREQVDVEHHGDYRLTIKRIA